MARLQFRPLPGVTATWYRFDTASGSNSPAVLTTENGGQILDLRADPVTGVLPMFYGPNGVTTLYPKQLTGSGGTVVSTGSALTGFDPAPAPPAAGTVTGLVLSDTRPTSPPVGTVRLGTGAATTGSGTSLPSGGAAGQVLRLNPTTGVPEWASVAVSGAGTGVSNTFSAAQTIQTNQVATVSTPALSVLDGPLLNYHHSGTGLTAKGQGDGYRANIDWIHDGNYAYLFHLTFGSNATSGASLACLAIGIDYSDGAGILLANKRDGNGLLLNQQATIRSASANGIKWLQSSGISSALYGTSLVPGAKELIELWAATHTAQPGEKLQSWNSNAMPINPFFYIESDTGAARTTREFLADGTQGSTSGIFAGLHYQGNLGSAGTVTTAQPHHAWLDSGGNDPNGPALRLFARAGSAASYYTSYLRQEKARQALQFWVGTTGAAAVNAEVIAARMEVAASTVQTFGVDVKAGNLPVPTAPTVTTATTGGSIAASTALSYRVAAVNAKGTTIASTAGTVTTGAGTATNTATATWVKVQGAESYKVYGRTSGTELLLATLGVPTRSVTDGVMNGVRTFTSAASTGGPLSTTNTGSLGDGVVTVTGGDFTSADIGRIVTLTGAGPSAGTLTQSIASVQSATQITLTAGAATAVTNGTLTVLGSDVLTSATAAFTSADVGKSITVTGAGAAAATLTAWIIKRISATQVQLGNPNTFTSLPATTSVTGATVAVTGGTVPLTFTDTGSVTPSGALPTAPAGTKLQVQAWDSQTGNMAEYLDSTGAYTYGVSKAGRPKIRIATAPVLADLADGDLVLSTNATGDLVVNSRVGGVLKTATVTVT